MSAKGSDQGLIAALNAGPKLSKAASWAVLLGLAAVFWGIDRTSKMWAFYELSSGQQIPVINGLLKFELYFNPGAAFSMGESFTVGLTIFSIVIFGAVLLFLAPKLRGIWCCFGFGLLLAGIAGNVTDRLFCPPGPFRGHVIDFISLKYFAVFNVADMCITGAAILFIVLLLFFDRKAKKLDEDAA